MQFVNYEEFKMMIPTIYDNVRTRIIAAKLLDRVIISNGRLYCLQENNTYALRSLDHKSFILKLVGELLENSFEALSENEKKLVSLEYPKTYQKIFTKASIDTYLCQLLIALSNNNINFDVVSREIHFKNGYIDLNNNEFKQRAIGQHYITKFIQRDYSPSAIDDENKVMAIVNKIYPNNDDLQCILSVLGSALSGESVIDQDILFLIGKGSSGKSFIMQLTSKTIQSYFKELQSDTFSINNRNIDKIINSFSNDPQILIAWVNELDSTRMDDSMFKKFVDGDMQTTKLYQDGTHNIKLKCKTIFTANELPNFKVDSGIVRRFRSYQHESLFVDNPDAVDESNNVFLKDKNLIESINDDMLNAWFNILIKYTKNWLDGHKVPFTQNFKSSTDEILASNDIIQDFIDAKLILIDEEHKIGKEQMREAFIAMYPQKHLTTLQIISALKDKGIKYNPGVRCNGIRGSFTNVRFKNSLDDNEIQQLSTNLDSDKKDLEINRLKDELATLKTKFELIEQENIKLKTKKAKAKTIN